MPAINREQNRSPVGAGHARDKPRVEPLTFTNGPALWDSAAFDRHPDYF